MGTIFEADVDRYLPTLLSKALTQLTYRDSFLYGLYPNSRYSSPVRVVKLTLLQLRRSWPSS